MYIFKIYFIYNSYFLKDKLGKTKNEKKIKLILKYLIISQDFFGKFNKQTHEHYHKYFDLMKSYDFKN